MALKTTVKVSHLSNLSDARYCAGMGVEMLGFRVIPGMEGYMPPDVFQAIRGWVAGPAIVAELYGLSCAGDVEQAVTNYAPDYLELSYEEYRKYHSLLSLPCLVYFPDPGAAPDVKIYPNISHALVDTNRSCADVGAFSMPVLVKIASAQLLKEKLDAHCFNGVVLEGPKEQRPGITNYEHLGNILEALDED